MVADKEGRKAGRVRRAVYVKRVGKDILLGYGGFERDLDVREDFDSNCKRSIYMGE